MVATVETLEKINSLSDDNINTVISLIDYLVRTQNLDRGENPFRKARNARKGPDMTEGEVDDFVSMVRKERNATRN